MSLSSERIQVEQNTVLHAAITTPSEPSAKPTVLFLHYWGGSSKTWSQVVNFLCDEFPTVALDFRGWGDSTGPAAEEAYSIKQMAADVEVAIKMLSLDNFALVGISMGAKVAQLVAAHNPAGLKSLVLVSPAPLAAFQLPTEMAEQQIHAYDTPESAEYVTSNILTTSALSKEIVDALVADQLRGNEWARAAWPKYGMTENYGALLGAIRVPTLVLAAEKDMVETPERVQERVHARIQGSQWGLIPGSGHLSPVERPRGVAESISSFI